MYAFVKKKEKHYTSSNINAILIFDKIENTF